VSFDEVRDKGGFSCKTCFSTAIDGPNNLASLLSGYDEGFAIMMTAQRYGWSRAFSSAVVNKRAPSSFK